MLKIPRQLVAFGFESRTGDELHFFCVEIRDNYANVVFLTFKTIFIKYWCESVNIIRDDYGCTSKVNEGRRLPVGRSNINRIV